MDQMSEPSAEATGPLRGVFWMVDGELLAFPFGDGPRVGVAKSGNTYNHRELWLALRLGPKPYDWWPRGRVDVTRGGAVRVYVSPHVDMGHMAPAIREAFRIGDESCRVIVDHSRHYRCHLDEGWEPTR